MKKSGFYAEVGEENFAASIDDALDLAAAHGSETPSV